MGFNGIISGTHSPIHMPEGITFFGECGLKKQSNQQPMTGNGKATTYKNVKNGDNSGFKIVW